MHRRIMMDERERVLFERQAHICKALSDPKRIMIIHELREGERTVGDLVGALGLAQANLSQHLAVLRDKGLVVAQRRGNNVFYSLVSPKITEACDMVRQVLAEQFERSQELAGGLLADRK
ncbi:MAG: metalloregulator ArsR/SmtB family transcription factor [Chloroflexota bacterium]